MISNPPDELKEAELCACLAAMNVGRLDALARFYDATADKTYGLILTMAGETHLAEEIMSDV